MRSPWRRARARRHAESARLGGETTHASSGERAVTRAFHARFDHASTRRGPLAAAPASLRAQALTNSGTLVYALEPDLGDNVQAAIERTIRHMNFIIRPIARHRLLRTNRPPAHLTFEMRPDSLVVTFEGHPPIVTPRDGTSAPWASGVSRETYYVKSSIFGDTLQQTITASDGHRRDDFVFSDDGECVALHVVLVAEHLPAPLDYTLEFRRLR
jgi:hypothetical protein